MKKIVFILLLTFCLQSFGQNEINNYKYIIVPKQFDAFKKPNQYQTSTLIKYLFAEKGFNVIYDDALPAELSSNRCLGLLVGLNDESGMFSTKASLSLKDCNSKEIYKTGEGLSKIKEYKSSYDEAIREAFNSSLANFNYSYKKETSDPITVSFKNDVKEVKEESIPVEQIAEKEVEKESVVIEKTSSEVMTPVKASLAPAITVEKEVSKDVVYAQNIPNGYQLVDSTPKIIMKIFKTSQQNIYLGEETSGTSGLVYAKDGAWFFEYYSGDKLVVKTLTIKF
tara:strand:+ start:6743 stop:7588 length:846 start_codon:yes stop_codon:yes gene_type:complete